MIGLFLIPFISAFVAFILPKSIVKPIALYLSCIPLAMLLTGHWMGASVNYSWMPPLGIYFHLSVDALSLLFLYLTAFIIPLSILAISWEQKKYSSLFYGLILFLQGLLIGFFTARDLALFTIFWEAMLLPLYFIINIWGGRNRKQASLKFLIYMIAGSTLMIAAVLALYLAQGSFNLDDLSQSAAALPLAAPILAVFLLAFAVKTPLFPFHAWLPDTYYEAPVAGTILLSALLSKAGIYGILRIGLELFPEQLKAWSPLLLGLAIAGVLYGALAAWRQKDYKRLIAYSSFSHVNFILAGLFIFSTTAQAGAILQALNHGVTITALFLVAGWLEERIGTTAIGLAGGLARYFPYLCWLTLFFLLSSVALPGLNNFIGELMIFLGLFKLNAWLAAFLGFSVILSVVYMLRWMQKVYFGTPAGWQQNFIDINSKHFGIALPLILLILWIGIYPTPVLDIILQAVHTYD